MRPNADSVALALRPFRAKIDAGYSRFDPNLRLGLPFKPMHGIWYARCKGEPKRPARRYGKGEKQKS